jgi:hypothetical protein
LTCKFRLISFVSQADVTVVEVEEHTQSGLVELCSRSAHGATQEAHGERDVRPRVDRTVQEGTYEALIVLEELGVNGVNLLKHRVIH